MTGTMANAASGGPVGILRLARLLARFRFRSAVNLLRARPAGPFTALLIFGVFSAVAYVGLFATALATVHAHVGRAGETAALQLMAGAIALASLGAKASGEGLFAGTPENEFLLARPVSLSRLVVARCLAALVGDPFGTLFLLPILIAAALAWNLPPAAWLVAVATSLCAQFTIAALSQTLQVAIVRWVPRRRRTGVLVLLRLFAALTLAAAWVAATWVLRAPRELAAHLEALQSALAWSPMGLLVLPMVTLRDAGTRAAVMALLPLLGIALAAGGLVGWVGRHAGARGWEEAGAPFAETHARAPAGPPLTLVRREWRLLARDRPRLAALVALPLLLFGVQLLGSVGWSLATATLPRVAMLTFSIVVYLGTLGPLPHMQHERRAFWILRSVPLPVGAIMRAKVKAWAAVLVGVAAVMYVPLALAVPGASPAAITLTGALVLAGALATTVLAVAMGCVVADLSDDNRPALGPGTAYLFLVLGGLLNVIFQGSPLAACRVLALYALAIGGLWLAGLEQVKACLDPEARMRGGPRLSDAAILLLLVAMLPVGLLQGASSAQVPLPTITAARSAMMLVLGLVAGALLLSRREKVVAGARTGGHTRAVIVGIALGVGARLVGSVVGGSAWMPDRSLPLPAIALACALALGEELVFRGLLQGALELDPASPLARRGRRWTAAACALGLAWLASPQVMTLSAGGPWSASTPLVAWWPTVLTGVATALARATSGRVTAACVARLALIDLF